MRINWKNLGHEVVFHPLSNVRRWRASLNHGNGKCPQDLKRDAMAASRRFVSCVRSLPADQAAPLWEIALAEFPQLSGGVGELPRPVGPKVLASLLLTGPN